MATGIGDNAKHSVLEAYFPDAVIPTECFGLQRVGFDEELYRILQEHCQPDPETDSGEKKRKRKRKAI